MKNSLTTGEGQGGQGKKREGGSQERGPLVRSQCNKETVFLQKKNLCKHGVALQSIDRAVVACGTNSEKSKP